MFGSPPVGTVHISAALPDRPTRAAKERAEPDPVVAIATRPQAGGSGWVMAGGERTILPDLRGGMELARGAFCELDLDVVLERVVAAAGHVSSARYVPLGVLDRSCRERERFVGAGVDEVKRRRIDALARGRGVLAELIASPVPLRVGELVRTAVRTDSRASILPNDDLLGRPGDDRWGAARGLVADREGWRGGAQRARRGGRSAASGFPGVVIDHARPYIGLKSFHSESRRAMDARDAAMRLARAVDGESDLEVILGPVAKPGRAVVSARTPAVEREHDWTGTSG